MSVASEKTVRGDFSGKSVTFHGIQSRFFKKKHQYFIETVGPNGKRSSFQVQYTFGHYPLQQYLVEIAGGRIQAFDVAWDSRKKADGGQRWFHLHPNEKVVPGHPFFWTNHLQNWNARCADCHSTGLERNYNVGTDTYDTRWQEINVGCEACHGPAARHVALATSGDIAPGSTGIVNSAAGRLAWTFPEGHAIARGSGSKSGAQVNMCGGCHSLRTQLDDASHGDASADFHDRYRLHFLESAFYFLDGQIREEVFVLGSFLQSKMHGNGVTCTDCHNPHSGKLVQQGNALCAQCHKADVYDTSGHHHHKPQSAGSQCVNCHMPARIFMVVDDRRDHSFTIPRPQLSIDLGVPNACADCHSDQDDPNHWALAALGRWGAKAGNESSQAHWSYLHARAASGDSEVVQPLLEYLARHELQPIVQASLLQLLSALPTEAVLQNATKNLASENPMVRRAAIASLEPYPAQATLRLLLPLVDDPSRSVRYQLAETMLGSFSRMSGEGRKRLAPLMAEYRQMLEVTADAPLTQLAIARYETAMRNWPAAELAYQRALAIAPNLAIVLLNAAEFYRTSGDESKSEALLVKALKVAPEDPGVAHSYGLHLVRKQRYEQALAYLARAARSEGANYRYAFVYAVALDNQGDTQSAIEVLQQADQKWPNRYDLISALVTFAEKTGNRALALGNVRKLQRIAGTNPEVQRLAEKYGL